jgi:uncharacterized protein
MHSAIFTGRLRHRRFAPRAHEFSYRLFMMYVDLAELDQVFARRWFWSVQRPALAWLRRADYLGDAGVSVDQAVRDRVQAETGTRPGGPIRMLTHLRYFGVGFNPVTFYYCFDATDTQVETIVAEITNTPWKERHAYVLDRRTNIGAGDMLRFSFKKNFHVSPFLGMDYDYDWRFGAPGRTRGERLTVHMENRHGDKAFDATLELKRREISAATLAGTLLSFPAMTATVVVGIYWQALRLWLKRVPFHSHPAKTVNHERDSRTSSIA